MKTSLSKLAFMAIVLLFPRLHVAAQAPGNNLQDLSDQKAKSAVPANSYLSIQQSGQLLYLSGRGPLTPNGTYLKGKLGADLNLAEGINAAKMVAKNQIDALKARLGDLNKIKQVIKVNGYVNATNDFSDQSLVMNGFSDAIIASLGPKGRHARTSVGVASLPENMAIEVEMIVELYSNPKNSKH